jgi:CubicO group peptidase (beta-lactamase class C family)
LLAAIRSPPVRLPERFPENAMSVSRVRKAFQQAVAEKVFPGAVVLAARDEEVAFEQAFGFRSLVPEQTTLELDTSFDLASLTKPLATTLAIMLLVREGEIGIDDRVTRFLPSFGQCGKHPTIVRHLLSHTSGLPAWKPYYNQVIDVERAGRASFLASREAKRFVTQLIYQEAPVSPPQSQCLYSDLGFIVLGELVETVTAMSLDEFCLTRIYRPLGLRSMGFIDLTRLRTARAEPVSKSIAPTEKSSWRNQIICGEVHDDNAYAMGGVAGHAGLFATARDIHELLACLGRCLRGVDDFLPPSLIRKFFTKDESVGNARFTLGWDTPSSGKSASGCMFSPRTVGHLGFTGTSLWWDLEKNCYIILLTNRVHPTRDNEKIRDFRPHIHDLIMKAMFS